MSTDLHTLSGAYAVNALSPEEAIEFRKHLEQCQACRDEVAELQEAAATMGASEALRPPAHLKARVLAAADATAQLPPKVAPIRPSSKPRWAPRLLAAAAAVVLVVAGGLVVRQLQSGDTANVVSPAVTQVFKAPDAHKAVVKTPQGEVAVATSQKLAEMAVDTDGLKPLGKSKVYQLWSIADGKAVSVGVLDDPDKGAAMGMPSQGTQVAITIEPAGGSPSPTGEQVVRVDPRAV